MTTFHPCRTLRQYTITSENAKIRFRIGTEPSPTKKLNAGNPGGRCPVVCALSNPDLGNPFGVYRRLGRVQQERIQSPVERRWEEHHRHAWPQSHVRTHTHKEKTYKTCSVVTIGSASI